MSKESLTIEDLNEFGKRLVAQLKATIQESRNQAEGEEIEVQWLKSGRVRKLLDISPGSLQNLRITGQIKFKKILGSYYYSKADLDALFQDGGGL